MQFAEVYKLKPLSTSRRPIKLLHPYDWQQLIIPELFQYYIYIQPFNLLKTNINPNNIENLVRTSWETNCISIIKINWLLPLREIICLLWAPYKMHKYIQYIK